MKYNKWFNKFFIGAITSLVVATATYAQDAKKDKKEQKKADMESLIQSRNFVFVANNAYPLSGRNINLTSMYDVRISADTIISDLPYYGRAYVAPMNTSEGGIHFTSTKFNYTIKDRKKGGWDITIVPNDTRDVRQMYLTVSEDGYGSLQVVSENRQDISFSGYVRAKNKSR